MGVWVFDNVSKWDFETDYNCFPFQMTVMEEDEGEYRWQIIDGGWGTLYGERCEGVCGALNVAIATCIIRAEEILSLSKRDLSMTVKEA